jgi:glutamate synthase domain-containing protein 2
VDTKELEAFNLRHCSPVDENGGVLGPPFPVVHNHLLCLDHVAGEVVVLAAHGKISDLLTIGCLIIVGTTVVSSANLMMVLESCLAMQSWVNRECKRGLSTHP